MIRFRGLVLSFSLLTGLVACDQKNKALPPVEGTNTTLRTDPPPATTEEPIPDGPTIFPELPQANKLQRGIQLHQVELTRNGIPMNVWIYLPDPLPKSKIPCIFIAGAGSPLFVGMKLGDGDRVEHLPYVLQGFAVVAFDMDGHADDNKPDQDAELIRAARAFKNSKGGLLNLQAAMDYVTQKVTIINSNEFYVAGHSSAATAALYFTANEPRIKACIAYAPATDVVSWVKPAVPQLSVYMVRFEEFIESISPKQHAQKIKVPVFLFHARDDTTTKLIETTGFAEELKRTNSNVTVELVDRGGHYAPMIQQGIPKAIDWLKLLNKR